MTRDAMVADRGDGTSSTDRWAQWIARGADHDRAVAKRVITAVLAVACGIAVWLPVMLVLA
jgi:hypothetical protein